MLNTIIRQRWVLIAFAVIFASVLILTANRKPKPFEAIPARIPASAHIQCQRNGSEVLSFSGRLAFSDANFPNPMDIDFDTASVNDGEITFIDGTFVDDSGSYGSYGSYNSYSSYDGVGEIDVNAPTTSGMSRFYGGAAFEIELSAGERLKRFRAVPYSQAGFLEQRRWELPQDDPEVADRMELIIQYAQIARQNCQ